MLTTFDQVRDWIIDNGFKRWILYKDGLRQEMIVDSAGFPSTDMNTRLATTEKYLRYAGGHAYAVGGSNANKNEMNVCAEIQLADMQGAQPTQGVGGGGYPNIGELRSELTDAITKQIRAEMQVKDMERREREIEKREKEFAEKQNGVLGAIVGYLAPYIPALNKGLEYRAVAGTEKKQDIIAGDTQEPLHVQPIVPTEEESPFTEEEEERMYNVGVRFKKAEPEDWLDLLESVADMAEKKDPMYGTAKGFLLKK